MAGWLNGSAEQQSLGRDLKSNGQQSVPAVNNLVTSQFSASEFLPDDVAVFGEQRVRCEQLKVLVEQEPGFDGVFLQNKPLEMHPAAEKIVLVQDNLNTHKPASLYQAFPAEETRRLIDKQEIHDTPKHGSWLAAVE